MLETQLFRHATTLASVLFVPWLTVRLEFVAAIATMTTTSTGTTPRHLPPRSRHHNLIPNSPSSSRMNQRGKLGKPVTKTTMRITSSATIRRLRLTRI